MSVTAGSLDSICNPQVNKLPAAIKLAREMMAKNPMLDLELARLTPPKEGSSEGCFQGPALERVLEILDAISKGSRVLNRLVHLLEDSDQRIRSKAALFIGKRVGNAHWAKKAEGDANHRVRANVIEALWDSPIAQCREMFERALRDTDNRVVGNAIYGIYRLNPSASIPLLTDMISHDDAGRRITAAWVMGKTDDWQFNPLLHKMIRDPEPRVRSIALKSMFKIKQANPEKHTAANDTSSPNAPEPVSQ